MKKKWIVLLLCLYGPLNAQEFTDLYGDYLGQPLPGDTPVVFARGLVSTGDLEHSAAMFSPDGNEVFWHVNRPPGSGNPEWISFTYTMRRIDNRWTKPERTLMKHPFYSVNGQRLYFLGEPQGPYYADKEGDGWGAWQRIDLLDRFPELQGMFYINSVTSDGTLYFTGKRAGAGTMHDQVIYRSKFIDGQYGPPELLPANINKPPHLNWIPYIAPDESYMIFSTNRYITSGEFGDLYITFPKSNGHWTDPVSLGTPINSNRQERLAHLTPDGKYLFFTRPTPGYSQDVYWVDARPYLPDPDGPILNASLGIRFNSIQTAIQLAQPGDEIIIEPGIYHESLTVDDKDIILCSIDPNDPNISPETIVVGDATHPVVTLSNSHAQLAGLTLRSGLQGLSVSGGSLSLTNSRVVNNQQEGILINRACATIRHCFIAGNQGTGITASAHGGGRRGVSSCTTSVQNCTIVQNRGMGVTGKVQIQNSIVYFNQDDPNGLQLAVSGPVTTSCIQGGATGAGNFDADPCFSVLGTSEDVNGTLLWIEGDYHLCSESGRWDPSLDLWVFDPITSPCIDAGHGDDPVTNEPTPNGASVNLGAYGGTSQASKSAPQALLPGQLRVTFIANEGFLLQSPHKTVLIDALFNRGFNTYTVPSEIMRGKMITGQGPFAHVDLLLATHRHNDHFYAPYVTDFLAQHPESRFVSAQQAVDLFDSTSDPWRDRIFGLDLSLGQTTNQIWSGIPVQVTRMRHDGNASGNGSHSMVYLLDMDGTKVLHGGDATIRFDTARYSALNLGAEMIDVLFLEWFDTSSATQNLVHNVIKPKIIIPMHFEVANFQNQANRFQQLYPQAVIFNYPIESRVFTLEP